jgi:hypothetical protein
MRSAAALLFLVLVFALAMHAATVSAQEGDGTGLETTLDQNVSDANQPVEEEPELSGSALICQRRIEKAKKTVSEMQAEGLPTARISDTILEAETLFEEQRIKEIGGQETDYSAAIAKADEAIRLREMQLQAKQELNEFRQAFAELEGRLDIDPLLQIYEEGYEELESQRYEIALEKVEEGHEKLIELQSFAARASAMYSAASKNFVTFVIENRIILSFLIGIPIILYVIFRDNIKRYRLNMKLQGLQTEIGVLENQIKNTQEAYFTKGEMADSTYQVREKVYGDMIRDLNREIALTREEIEKTKRIKMMKMKRLFKVEAKEKKEKGKL